MNCIVIFLAGCTFIQIPGMIRCLHTWIQKGTKNDNEYQKQLSKKRRTTHSIKTGKSKDKKLRGPRSKFSCNKLSDPLKIIIVHLGNLKSEFQSLKMEQVG